jgi:4a-hydroxytetrahydrobiopterin dehydratase
MDKSTPLTQKRCQPCEGLTVPLNKKQAAGKLNGIPGWQINEKGTWIARTYNVKNFMEAIRFIQKIAAIAEAENHHPDIHLTGYRKLQIKLSTHAVGGLSDNDFIVAAKINQSPVALKL